MMITNDQAKYRGSEDAAYDQARSVGMGLISLRSKPCTPIRNNSPDQNNRHRPKMIDISLNFPGEVRRNHNDGHDGHGAHDQT